MTQATERPSLIKRLLLGSLYVAVVLFVSFHLLEYVSFRILVHKKILSDKGIISQVYFGQTLDFYQGGLDNNQEGFVFKGYNDSLREGELTYADQYGFLHGDSFPLSKDKPANTIRVVLTGGSGMYGSLQATSIIRMFNYPEGYYDYPTSIAGKLKSALQLRYPQYNWQVINAAVVRHLFHQSFAAYYQKIHDVHPDIIINMDGFNDKDLPYNFLAEGDPYITTANHAAQGLTLEILQRSAHWGYTCMLLNYSLLCVNEEKLTARSWQLKSILSKLNFRLLAKAAGEQADNKTLQQNPELSEDSFALLQPLLEKNFEKELWLFSAYQQQLKSDSVYSIFCYQPMLDRNLYQKTLSEKEEAMRQHINNESPKKFITDTLQTLLGSGFTPDLQQALTKTGNAKYYMNWYMNRYFINNYIVPKTDSVVRSYGAAFIDIGNEMRSISAEKEFYLDYTHTTPFGNAFIANVMADKVSAYMQTRHR